MKRIILIGTFIISLFVTSCNKENLPDKGTANSKTITISANISDDPETRLTYTEESNKLKLGWSASEKFMMYRGTHSAGEEFTKASGNNNFSGKDPNPSGTGDYYAVYGNNISNASGVLTVDISKQIGTNTENGINSFMVASSTKIDDGSTLNFAHKLTILKLELTFPKGTTGTVKEVIIGGLHNKANYNLLSNEYSYSNENKKYIRATNDTKGFTIEGDKITAYISVFPEVVKAKQVAIIAVIGEGTGAVDYSYTMQSAKTLNVGKLVPVSVALIKMEDNFKSAYTKSDYYMWDAYKPYENITTGTWGPTSAWYNPTTRELASASCKDCPTAQQMVAYLKAGVYWDDNTEVIEGQKTYTLNGDATKHHTGLWVKKRRYIENFDSETDKRYTTTTETFTKLSTLTDEKVKNIRTSGEYFFLPACGNYNNSNSGSFGFAGAGGYYWTSTPNTTYTNGADRLYFSSDKAHVGGYDRSDGVVPMPRL